MSWQDVLKAYRALQDEAHAPLATSLHEKWASYRAAVLGTQIRRPFHLRILLEELDNRCQALGVEKGELSILDHGCGGGMTVLYLIALGYGGARGVDIGSNDNFSASIELQRQPESGLRYSLSTMAWSSRSLLSPSISYSAIRL